MGARLTDLGASKPSVKAAPLALKKRRSAPMVTLEDTSEMPALEGKPMKKVFKKKKK